MKLLFIIENDLGLCSQVNSVISRASRRFNAFREDLSVVYHSPVMGFACPVWHTSVSKVQSDHLSACPKAGSSYNHGSALYLFGQNWRRLVWSPHMRRESNCCLQASKKHSKVMEGMPSR